MSALTPKQRAFAREFALDGNRRQAAIRAGYRVKSASERGGNLLQDPRIQDLIAKLKAAQVEPDDMTLNGHVRSLAAIRDEAREAKGSCPHLAVALRAEVARGKAFGFQPSGAKQGDTGQGALTSPSDEAWTQAIAGEGWREAIGADGETEEPGECLSQTPSN